MVALLRPGAGAPTGAAAGLASCAAGPSVTGPDVDGLRRGLWGTVHPDGRVEQGRCVAGWMDGAWMLRQVRGAVVARERWCHGRAVEPALAGPSMITS